ncbi:hypothetical protein [Fusobacterium sp. PH5-44]|uniref:hypothetical protein n=1 Tax=unclassified Fusobacterium TaxID=2648384 RepID=UPI003D19B3E2
MEKIKFDTSGYYKFIQDGSGSDEVGQVNNNGEKDGIWIHYRSFLNFIEVVGYENGKRHGVTLKFSPTEDKGYRMTGEIIYLNDCKISEKVFSFKGELINHKIFGQAEIEYEYYLMYGVNHPLSITVAGFPDFSSRILIGYQYKAIGHFDFEIDIDIEFFIPKLFKTPQETYKYRFDAFVTREQGKIVLKIEDELTKEIIDTIHWEEHWKYKTTIFNETSLITSMKDVLDKKNATEKEYEDWQKVGEAFDRTIEGLPILDDSNYLPYSETFEEMFKKNNKIIEEGQKYYFEIPGWDLIPIVDDSALNGDYITV